jgi:hypothetical protein
MPHIPPPHIPSIITAHTPSVSAANSTNTTLRTHGPVPETRFCLGRSTTVDEIVQVAATVRRVLREVFVGRPASDHPLAPHALMKEPVE